MKVACVSGFAGWWGNYPANVLDLEEGPSVGGGEENFLRCAAGLVGLGHQVTAWHCGEAGNWRGVEFRDPSSDLSGAIVTEPWDAVVAWTTLRPLEWTPAGTKRIYVQQLNDLIEPGQWDCVDCVVSPSESHAQQLPNWGWRGRNYAVVHNGLDPWKYGEDWGIRGREVIPVPRPWAERPMDVGYWSSPDRGLHHLLRAWPEVKQAVPGARLHVFYELDRLLKNAVGCPGPLGDRIRLLAELLPRAKADKSIIFHGSVPRNALRKIQVECRVMAYPYVPISWCEGFCGSLNQGVAAGCHCLATPLDALPSLYGDAVTWMPPEPEKLQAVLPHYIIRALLDEPWSRTRLEAAEPHRYRFTWERAAKEFEAACRGESWRLTSPTADLGFNPMEAR